MLVLIWSVVWWLSLHELLLHPAPICPDAGPDLCTLCWWCFPSINRCKYSTGTCGGQHLLQLALVVFFLPAAGANTPLAHVVVISRCNLRWWCFFFQPLAQILYLHSCNLHCVVVVACGGGIYIYILGNQNGGARGYCFRMLNIILLLFRRLIFEQNLIISMY